jgi:hypothetical protein
MKLVYVGFSYQHHGAYSGYNQIKKTEIYDEFIDFQKSYDFYIKISNPNQNWYIRLFKNLFFPYWWWPEFYLIFKSLFNPGKYIFHIIYGENIFKFLGNFKFGNKIVLTLHQPPSVLGKNRRFLKSLRNVDKIILMSKEQEQFFNQLIPDTPVKLIPHGVDTNYFKPGNKTGNKLLQIGNWLRDFEFASKVYHYLYNIDKNLTIYVVSRSKYHHFFSSNKNVICMSDITDDQLLKLFQETKLIFLPLKDFTANNSLVEGISCGNEVLISTKIENWNEELGFKVHFVEPDCKKVGDLILILLDSTEIKSISNRKFIVENLDWKVIGHKTKSFIED